MGKTNNISDKALDFINNRINNMEWKVIIKNNVISNSRHEIFNKIEELYFDILDEFAKSIGTNGMDFYEDYHSELTEDKFSFINERINEFLQDYGIDLEDMVTKTMEKAQMMSDDELIKKLKDKFLDFKAANSLNERDHQEDIFFGYWVELKDRIAKRTISQHED